MANKLDSLLQYAVAFLVCAVGIGESPFAAAVGLLVVLGYKIADRYFHDSFHDENKASIGKLTVELEKIRQKQSQYDLKATFGGKNG